MGYHQQTGGGWSGDLLIVDLAEMKEMWLFPEEINIKQFKAKEVVETFENDNFVFPLTDPIYQRHWLI